MTIRELLKQGNIRIINERRWIMSDGLFDFVIFEQKKYQKYPKELYSGNNEEEALKIFLKE